MEADLSSPAKKKGLPLAREGFPLVAAGLGAAFLSWVFGLRAPACLFGLASLYLLWFFRDPERTPPEGEHLLVAPADGRVIAVEASADDRYLPEGGTRLSIFMSPFDVHVNRAPASGRVEKTEYRKGRFVRAFAPEASEENERNAVWLRTPQGPGICFVQVAGFLARRIVCYVREGMEIDRGARCGIVMFGSRVDVYLPPGFRVRVRPGDRTRAGESVIAEAGS
ncbi:MAG: phosphatidylserine decarboxylase proenzyme [Candidatus Binatia bacterium]|nr:MAG: phosphatidylserine decarboxylase proenzyme [Candidatus Binatia bacterium]